jgi:hypothetical protein
MICKLVPIRIVKLLVLFYYKSITPPSYYLSPSCTVLFLMKKLIVREHTHTYTYTHTHTITTLVVNKTIISLDVRRTINAQDVPHAPQGGGGRIFTQEEATQYLLLLTPCHGPRIKREEHVFCCRYRWLLSLPLSLAIAATFLFSLFVFLVSMWQVKTLPILANNKKIVVFF